MSQVIYKYTLSPTGYTELELPRNARPLWAEGQRGQLCLWAMVDPKEEQTKIRKISIVGTGHEMPDHAFNWRHLNTFLMQGGSFVFHAFEVIS